MGWGQAEKVVFDPENGADRYRSVVSSSLRQNPVGSLFKADTATFLAWFIERAVSMTIKLKIKSKKVKIHL